MPREAMTNALSKPWSKSWNDFVSAPDGGPFGNADKSYWIPSGIREGISDTLDLVQTPGSILKGDRSFGTEQDIMNATPGMIDLAMGAYAGSGLLSKGKVNPNMVNAFVYQGGPHKYGPEGAAKSLEHIGKGEGAQAYGWGRYDAGNIDVAKQYRDQLGGAGEMSFNDVKLQADLYTPELNEAANKITSNILPHLKWMAGETKLDGSALPNDFFQKNDLWVNGATKHEIEQIAIEAQTGKPIKDIIADRIAVLDAGLANQNNQFDRADFMVSRSIMDELKKQDIQYEIGKHLYKHDLPDEDIARYLDWDKPLSEQPESVRTALKKWGNYPDNMKGAEMYEAMGSSLAKPPFNNSLRSTSNPDTSKAASEALGRAGIPGLKYYDEMSRPDNVANWRKSYDITPPEQTVRGKWMVKNKDPNSKGEFFDTEAAAIEALNAKPEFAQTRNYVTWDQDVLNRMKLLERNGENMTMEKALK